MGEDHSNFDWRPKDLEKFRLAIRNEPQWQSFDCFRTDANINMSRSSWDRLVKRDSKRSMSYKQASHFVSTVGGTIEDWFVPVALNPNYVYKHQYMKKTSQELMPTLIKYLSCLNTEVVMYAAVTDAVWLTEFFSSLPRVNKYRDQWLLNTNIDKVVVWTPSAKISSVLMGHGLMDAERLSNASRLIRGLTKYSRLVDPGSQARSGQSEIQKRIVFENRHWDTLPPVWGVLIHELLIAGRWYIDNNGVIQPEPKGELIHIKDASRREVFDAYKNIMTQDKASDRLNGASGALELKQSKASQSM